MRLLRELESVDQHNPSPAWIDFRTRLNRLLKDTIRLSKPEDCSSDEFAAKSPRLHSPLDQLTHETTCNPDLTRLVKRLAKYRQDLLTFLDEPGLPYDNNLAERDIRPTVLVRKNSFYNMSQDGAIAQAVSMTIYRTLKPRGHDPIETIVSALRHYLSHNFSLPPLPSLNSPSDG